MANGFPTEVFVLDGEGLLATRFAKSGRGADVTSLHRYRFAEPPFADSPVSPRLSDPTILTEVLARARKDLGGVERVSLLLPDSWFRLNLLDLPSAGDRETPQVELVRFAVKRTLPVRPEEVRFAWVPLQKNGTGQQVFAVGAMETTLTAIESAFRNAGMSLALIEPVGVNAWNAVAARVADPAADRLFLHVAGSEFTMGIFRGAIPRFLRSRMLSGSRSLEQEILLSASYMKSRLEWSSIAESWVSGNGVDQRVLSSIETEFEVPVHRARIEDFAHSDDPQAETWGAELIACTGVFTA